MERCGNRRPRVERLVSAWNQGIRGDAEPECEADDPLIVDTLKVVDALLAVDTPFGRTWHRYNGDGYGEHDDGSPFDGTG